MLLDENCPAILSDFLVYHETSRGHSRKTSDEYFLDLRLFFRFLKLRREMLSDGAVKAPLSGEEPCWESIPITDVDRDFVAAVTLSEVNEFIKYLSRARSRQPNSPHAPKGLSAAARARKVASIKSFFKYLTNKAHLLTENPVQDLDAPRLKKALPHYLSLEESLHLLEGVAGPFQLRDYCILTLFLNCGLRISELAGLNLSDVRDETIRVLGKGNKERILYLNDACRAALKDYLSERLTPGLSDANALFVSRNRRRISVQAVHNLVKKHLGSAGLDTSVYSTHKLRHTAATLMLGNGVDVRTLQEVLGHDHLNTTQIYTHIDSAELRMAARANPLSQVRKTQKRSAPEDEE